MAKVSVRYIVDDVDEAIPFYTGKLGFEVVMHPAPTFAILDRGELRLLLSAPSERGGGGQTLSDGRRPEPVGPDDDGARAEPAAGVRGRGRAHGAVRVRCTSALHRRHRRLSRRRPAAQRLRGRRQGPSLRRGGGAEASWNPRLDRTVSSARLAPRQGGEAAEAVSRALRALTERENDGCRG